MEMTHKLHLGDSREVMKTIEDNSIDSIVTDPPAGINFMGRDWDTHVNFQDFICEVFTEALRVLKPGGHGLVWAIPRTSHHTVMGLERAGFEIRDKVFHIFGSGFPKSMNISKEIMKLTGDDGIETGEEKVIDLGMRGGKMHSGRPSVRVKERVKEPTNPLAIEWQGWGTALKPAVEEWILIRKPISEKNIALNVLKWGTGGLNIDDCRIPLAETENSPTGSGHLYFKNNAFNPVLTNHSRSKKSAKSKGIYGDSKEQDTHQTEGQKLGRFPSHLIHDGSKVVTDQFPNTKSGKVKNEKGRYEGKSNTEFLRGDTTFDNQYGDEGSAARFFYCAKTSTSERNEGCSGLEEKENLQGLDTRGRTLIREDGTETLVNRWKAKAKANNHPTVKPQALMEYLIKLITPKSGTVLDMFMGSGSTGVAAVNLEYSFTGIEKEKEYFEIAEARINSAIKNLPITINFV